MHRAHGAAARTIYSLAGLCHRQECRVARSGPRGGRHREEPCAPPSGPPARLLPVTLLAMGRGRVLPSHGVFCDSPATSLLSGRREASNRDQVLHTAP